MNDFKEKLKNVEINELEFTVRHKGKKLHSTILPIPKYAEEVFNDDDVTFHNFFMNMTRKFKEEIDREHKRKFFDRQDGSGKLVE